MSVSYRLCRIRPAKHQDYFTPQVMLTRGNLAHKEESLTVIGQIEEVTCPMVVDAGANITTVRLDVLTGYVAISMEYKPRPVFLKTATQETTTVHSKLRLKSLCLALTSFMAHGSSWLYTVVGSLLIGTEEVPLAFQVARCHRVVPSEDTMISPCSETLVPAKIEDEPYGEPWRTVGASLTTKLPPSVVVGKTLVDAQCDCIPVRMVNLTNEPRMIPSGINEATCQHLESTIYPGRNYHQEHPGPD